MSRLIDADKLLENKFKNDISWNAFEKLIKRQPTVDAVEVKHGHWEEQIVDDSTIIEIWQSARCSKCGRYHTTPYAYYFDEFNYCPHCGAKMDEVTE